ncbi:MAG: hypothetical protein RL642_581, partial [Bacteroidota bacterium]
MQARKHYYWIDLLRFLCALLVVLAHYRGNFFVAYGLLPEYQKTFPVQVFYLFTRFGEEPVLVFFVLSGFLVGGRTLEKALNAEIEPKAYFIDRSVRILLPLLASSILVVILQIVKRGAIPFEDIIGSFIGLQGTLTESSFNPPLWSLAYEIWFYILIGCVLFFMRGHRIYKLIAIVPFLLGLYVFSLLNLLYLFVLLIGLLSYFIKKNSHSTGAITTWALLILILLSFLVLQTLTVSKSIDFGYLKFVDKGTASIFLAGVTGLLISHIVGFVPKSHLASTINKIGSKLSQFSYSLYLTHYPLMEFLSFLGVPKSEEISFVSVSAYIIALILSVVVAYLVYLVSEKHTGI